MRREMKRNNNNKKAEHHLIPTGYGKASDKSSPTGVPDYRGLCLTLINRQFIQSALWIWKKKSFWNKNACAPTADKNLNANRGACSRRFSASQTLPFTLKLPIYNQSTPTQTCRDYIVILNCNTSLSLCKLFLLLIYSFPPSRKWANNSDILNQREGAGGRDTHRYTRLVSSVGGVVSQLIPLLVHICLFCHLSPSWFQASIICRLKKPN